MAFHRKPLEILKLKGDALEIAFALGKRRAKKIQKRVQFWESQVETAFVRRQAELRQIERGFLQEARRQAPRYLEEIQAMAEGACLPFAGLFRLNLTELLVYAEKCSDLILPVQNGSTRGILIAHNEDWDPRRNDVFVLHAQLPDLEYVVLGYDGYLPGLSAGRNSFGLLHSVNYLRPKDFRMGLPRIFVTRHLLTARNFDDCRRFLRSTRRAFGQAIHLAQGERYLGFELTASRCAELRLRLPFCHTNHYLASSLKRESRIAPAPSHRRLNTARHLLNKTWPRSSQGFPNGGQARHLAKKILGDRSHLPWALWREADSPEESSATLALVLIGTDRKEFEVHRRRPDRNTATRIRLDRP